MCPSKLNPVPGNVKEKMDLLALLPRLPRNKAAILIYENGKPVRHPHAVLFDDVCKASADLARWGVKAGMRIGIYAPNSYAWLVFDLALIELKAVSVPFTDDFSGEMNRPLLDRYEISLLLTAKVHEKLFPERPDFVAFIDAPNGEIRPIARPALPHDADFDEMSMVFSSGSAGGLKGLLISRKGVEATLPPIYETIRVNSRDRLLLFLPMSNFQQRTMYYGALWYDFDIIITDYPRLFFALKDLHPTMLVAPPMFYELIETRFSSLVKRSGMRSMCQLLSMLPIPLLRRVIARKLFPDFHNTFGGRMRLLITGMAPVRPSATRLFDCMQLPLAESYGLVETGSLTYRPPHSRKHASVGKLLDGIQVRLLDDGEIIVQRKHMLTLRYFQCAEGENERTFIGNGEVATGDIGQVDAEGYVTLLGRKKEIIITSGGYKIHPEVIEADLDHCSEIAKSTVFARKGAPALTAIVRLRDPESAEAKALVEQFIQAMNTARSSAKIGEIIFTAVEFSRENEMLRPNLKLDRKKIAQYFNI